MRPILWGTIWFVIGMIGWLIFSFMEGIARVSTGGAHTDWMKYVWFFGLIFYFSLPVAILIEIICWIKARKKKHKTK